jgi:hypothetical protein
MRLQRLGDPRYERIPADVFNQHGVSVVMRERNTPVGIFLIGAGLVLGTHLTHEIGQGDAQESGG